MATTMPTTRIDALLPGLGNLPAAYGHEWRVVTPRAPLVVPGGGGIFKWYHVHREGIVVPPDVDAAAQAEILTAAAAGWDLSYGLNVAQVHLSTDHAFAIAGIWRGHQELWMRIRVRALTPGAAWERPETEGEDWPAACVWEMGVHCHERMAWHRYLFSARDDAAKRAWLADTYAGPA